jgi:hypothetical protein
VVMMMMLLRMFFAGIPDLGDVMVVGVKPLA